MLPLLSLKPSMKSLTSTWRGGGAEQCGMCRDGSWHRFLGGLVALVVCPVLGVNEPGLSPAGIMAASSIPWPCQVGGGSIPNQLRSKWRKWDLNYHQSSHQLPHPTGALFPGRVSSTSH